MKLLNLCCGSVRPTEPWINMDNLRSLLAEGTPERINLDAEPNYVDFDVLSGPLPFSDNTFDGILASHCIEHWDCQEAVRVLSECQRILKTGGVIIVSVPDSEVFLRNHKKDTVENAEYLFGEPIHLSDGEITFMGYALFNRHHKQVLSFPSLWCLLLRSGFRSTSIDYDHDRMVYSIMIQLLNRRMFSLIVNALK